SAVLFAGRPNDEHYTREHPATGSTPIPITITRADDPQTTELSTQEQSAIASERRRRRRQRTSGLQEGHLSTNTAQSNHVEAPAQDNQPSQTHDGYHVQPSQRGVNVPVVTSDRGRTRTRQPQQQPTASPTRSYGSPSPIHTSNAAPSFRSLPRDSRHAPPIATVRSVEAATPARSCREAPSIRAFDEDAYLSGKITIVSGSVNNPRQYKDRYTRIDEPYNDDISNQENTRSKAPFDEDAYLSGEVAIFGDEPAPRPRKLYTTFASNSFVDKSISHTSYVNGERAPWVRDETERNKFDEEAFLGSRSMSREASCESVPWQREEDTDKRRDFDEDAFLGRKSSRGEGMWETQYLVNHGE
ncbi:hypothetical protein NP493_504g03062, partial [Ridgeia piscesae]